MPNIDLPLDELKKYRGTNPTPLNMFEFWQESLDELRETKAGVVITPAEFQTPLCDCYDLTFKGIDDEKIYVKMLLPKNISKPVPALVEFHGYGGNSGDWSRRMVYPASGIAYFAMDCRDQMGKSGDEYFRTGNLVRGLLEGPKKSYYRKVYLDAVRLLDIIFQMKDVDRTRISTLGYSQGGAISLVSAALENRIFKVFAVYPYLSDFKRVWNLDLGDFAYQELRDFFRWYDPQHKNENKFFETLGYIDVKNFVENIKGEVTMVTGLMDRICPPSTQFAVYNNIKSKKEHIIYPDFGHENINGLEDLIYQWALNLLK